MAKATSIASSDHNERLEPQILRHAKSGNVDGLREIVEQAKARNSPLDNLLRIALTRASEYGNLNATTFLLEAGGDPNDSSKNRLSPLFRAVERDPPNQIAIVKVLLKHGADPESRDNKGRTALMTAAWKDHYHVLELLIRAGADINGKDARGRNVLHNLAADRQMKWGNSTLELILSKDIHIDGENARDELGRTPLHWACATGKMHLARMLLDRPGHLGADIHATDSRGKTGLHLASSHDREDVAELLLQRGADVNAQSDGGWTPLHIACDKGSTRIVETLLRAGALVSEKLLNGATPLHWAAQGGHLDAVKALLQAEGIKKTSRDSFGITPFLRAAQNHHKDVVELLAPFNHASALSRDAEGACRGFTATIVDFGNFRNENRVTKCSVYDLLYGKASDNHRKAAYTVLPQEDKVKGKKVTEFRWIHLPANNISWLETLLTKWFIEEGAHDIEGFKALEKSFTHQHRGKESHSHFMRPLCQSTPRAPRLSEPKAVEEETEVLPPPTPTIIINGALTPKQDQRPVTPTKRSFSSSGKRDASRGGDENESASGKEASKNQKENFKKGKGPKSTVTEKSPKNQRKSPNHPDNRHPRAGSQTTKKEPQIPPKGNIITFMPYLHFETTAKRKEMHAAIRKAEMLKMPLCPNVGRANTADEMLIRAHLNSSSVSLHVRRTLDQSFYHNISTESRDEDQVVYRYQLMSNPPDWQADPKIVMVDQLWMWVLGMDLVVTSFPQRWDQPKNDPLCVLDSIIEDINSKTREPVKSVYELATMITARCSGLFDRHRMGDSDLQFFDMFESSIGNATDKETELFKEFNDASGQASAWLQYHSRVNKFSRLLSDENDRLSQAETFKFEETPRKPFFVDKLLDIGQETELLKETKDIRDELNMIKKVLEDQKQVVPGFETAVLDIYLVERHSQLDIKKRFRDQMRMIDLHILDIERMDKQAERIYNSIKDMLDLKQKHANAFEARFARDQARGTHRQSRTVMVFTIVTIIFLPLSFIAAFFTINIQEFPGQAQQGSMNGNSGLPLGYVSKYMFGIGFAISLPLIFIALNLDDISDGFAAMQSHFASKKRLKEKARREREMEAEASAYAMAGLGLHHTHTTAGGSLDGAEDWALRRMSMAGGSRSRSPRLSRETAGTLAKREREKVTGFIMRISGEVERSAV